MATPRSALNVPDVRDVPVYIYALCEPDTGAIRYVGKSRYPRARLAQHISNGLPPVKAWVKGLAARGLRPWLQVLQEAPAWHDASKVEREQIRSYARSGCRLLNELGMPGGHLRLVPLAKESAGLRALRAWLQQGNSQAELARALGVSKVAVHAWSRGSARPRPHLRRPIAELTKGYVPEDAWVLPSEREAEEAAFAAIRGDSPSPTPPAEGSWAA